MELIVINEIKAVDLGKAGGAQPLIDQIRERATSVVFDVNTKDGREGMRGMAAKVAKSKTALDALLKGLTDSLNAQKAPILGERNLIKVELDKVRDEVRQPLTEYEEAEKLRINSIKADLEWFPGVATALNGDESIRTAQELKEILDSVQEYEISETSFQEFTALAAQAKEEAIEVLDVLLSSRIIYENEQAELAQHRADKEKREQDEAAAKAQQAEEERTRKAHEKARKQAEEAKEAADKKLKEQKAKAELDKIEASEKAENDAAAALAKAEQDKQAAIDAERRKGEAEKAAEEDRLLKIKQKEERAAANKNHQKRVNKEAVSDLVAVGFANDTAKEVIIAISSGVIKHVTINYRGIS